MKKATFYLPIILFCTALFTGYAVKAQDIFRPDSPPIPAKIQGNWALPDCKAYDEAMILTRHFYLKSTVGGSAFWPVQVISPKKDYWVMSIEGQSRPVRREEDGVLKIGTLSAAAAEKWPQSWDKLLLDGKHEYMGCADIPALLPDPLVRVMTHMDKIETTCRAGFSEPCKRLLFDIVDDDKNKKISVREMKTGGAMLAGLAALIENHSLSRNALDKIFYESFRETDRIVATVLKDKEELTYKDFSGFSSKSNSSILQNALNSIGKYFPALGPSR